MKKKIKFIINPLSGGKNKNSIPGLIYDLMDQEKYDIDLHITTSEENTLAIAIAAKNEKIDAIVAVGGDGTLNNIARFLTGTEIALGIIPMGSGNGFARELHIPMNSSKALELINEFNIKTVDTGSVNNKIFMNVCGIGFDAHVTGLFAGSKTRGLKTYAQLTLKEMRTYKPQTYQLTIDGKKNIQKAFMLVVCNGTQYGNNAYIAPEASFDDGMFNITIVEDFKWFELVSLIPQLFLKKIHEAKNVKTFFGKSIEIMRNEPAFVNIDGESVWMNNELLIDLKPLSLKVIVPTSNFTDKNFNK